MKFPSPDFFRVLLVTFLTLGSTCILSNAADMFIKFDGVDGESQDSEHAGESDALAWSWGIRTADPDDPDVPDTRRGGGIIEELQCVKVLDQASPKLLEACAEGRVYPDVTLTVRKLVNGARVEYIKIVLTNVVISSVATGSTDGEAVPTEMVSLNFETVKYTYSVYDSDGNLQGITEMDWEIETGSK